MKFLPIILVIVQSAIGLSQVNHTLKASIESIIKDSSENVFNGIVHVSNNDGELTVSQGFSDFNKKKKLTPENQFVIGSISKQITAALVLREAELGLLSLNDPIGKYLKNLDQSWKDSITIHHLLVHTHGIRTRKSPLGFRPGTKFEYSQIGYQLLAEILEIIHQDSFNKITDEFFKSKGMNATCFPTKKSLKKLAKGYVQSEDGEILFEHESFENYVPAGGFVSTVGDMALWNELLYSGSVVNDSSLNLMRQPFATRMHPIFGEIEYGYGLTFRKGEAYIQIGALGYAPGYVSANFYFPKSRTSVIIFQNLVTGLPDFKMVFKFQLAILRLVRASLN